MAGLKFSQDGYIHFTSLAAALSSAVQAGTYTIAVLVKFPNLGDWNGLSYIGRAALTQSAGLSKDNIDRLRNDVNGVTGSASTNATSLVADKEYIVGYSVTTGSTPKFFFIDVQANTITHETGVNVVGTDVSPENQLNIGCQGDATDRANAIIGMVGWWDVDLTNTQKAALNTNKNSTDWTTNAAGAPKFLAEMNVPYASVVDWAGLTSGKSLVGVEPEVEPSTFSNWDFIAADVLAPGTIRAIPFGTGITLTTPATAWGFSSWATLIPSMPFKFGVHGLDFQFTIPALTFGQDFTEELIIEVGIGAAGSEVTKLQIPYSVRSDSAQGFYLDSDERIALPELYEIPAGSRVAVRLANLQALAAQVNALNLFGTELASVTAVSSSDTGAGAEAQVETAAIASSDAGGDADANVLKAVYTSADVNGTTTEAITQTAPYTQADANGTTTELGTVSQKYVSADSGTDAEANVLTAATTQADANGTTTETALVTFAVSSADVGTDTEAIVLTAAYTSADTGTDAGNEVAKIGLIAADTGSDVEAQALTAVYTSADTGTDAEASKTVITTGDTNGATTEAITLTVAITQADANATVNDVGVVGSSGNFTQADNSNPAVDAAALVAVLSMADTGSSTEAAAVTTPIAGADSGTGTETAIVVAKYTSGDTGNSTTRIVRNLFANGGLEVNVVGVSGGGATVTQDGTKHYGAWSNFSARVMPSTPGSYGDASGLIPLSGATAGKVFTVQTWVYADISPGVNQIGLYLREVGGAQVQSQSLTGYTLKQGWNFITHTRTIVENDRTSLYFIATAPTLGSLAYQGPYFLDNIQFEESPVPGPYVETNGAAANGSFPGEDAPLAASYTTADSGTSTETASEAVSLSRADSGTSTEPATLLVALSGLDVASDLEVAAQVAALVAAEAGASLDTSQITAKFILPDAGSGTETTAPLGLLAGDTATGIDAASLKVLISQIDAGFAVDTETSSSLSFFDPNAPHPHWIRATKIETPKLLSAGGDKPRTLIQFDDDPKLRKAGV